LADVVSELPLILPRLFILLLAAAASATTSLSPSVSLRYCPSPPLFSTYF
jgi:hypothetical protein